ncbi:MAG: Trm112 family protein [Candidatus Heimdallarchaeota archaeon]
MKPWLFDILACPMDKHYPLELYIFSYETKPDVFKKFLDLYENRDITLINKDEIIDFFKEDENFFIKDDLVIEKTPIDDYFNLLLSSIKEVDHIHDNSSNEISKKCFEKIKTKIKSNINNFIESLNPQDFNKILPELYFINKIKIETEIQSGILFCKKCCRWFPIIETIPQMLPDEYRNEEEETQFLKINKNLLDEKFFKQDLKPFNI